MLKCVAWRSKDADQFDAVRGKKSGRGVLAKPAAHRVGAAFGGFIDPDFVDQRTLPFIEERLVRARRLGCGR